MKMADLKSKSRDQLSEELLSLSKERLNLRLQKSSGQLASLARMREVRRAVARVKTLLNQDKGSVRKGASKSAQKKVKE